MLRRERGQVMADISGHSSYFNEGSASLRNIGLITAGYLDEVNVNDGVL
jgi:hypothetical protein